MDGNDLVTEPSRRSIISQAWTRISQVSLIFGVIILAETSWVDDSTLLH